MMRFLAGTMFAVAAATTPALAQTSAALSPPSVSEWRLDIGAATLVTPRYAGSDQTRVRPIPYVEASYRDLARATVRDGRVRLDLTPVRSNGFYLGGEASLLFGQNERIAQLPAGFGNIPATPELGAVGGFEVQAFQVEGRVRRAIAGHGGATADVAASLRLPLPGTLRSGRPTIIAIGPQASWGDRKYAQRFFGIDPDRAQRTGLRRYDPADALTYGGSVAVIQPLWRQLTFVGVGSVSRLTGDAARSPIVRARTNHSVVLALARRFQSRRGVAGP